MNEKEFIWRIRLNIFHHTDEKKKTIIYLCRKYGVSRTCFASGKLPIIYERVDKKYGKSINRNEFSRQDKG